MRRGAKVPVAWVGVALALVGGEVGAGKSTHREHAKPARSARTGATPTHGSHGAAPAPAPVGDATVARLRRGVEQFDAGDYVAAHNELEPLARAPLANRDLVLYLLGASAAMSTPPRPAEALARFREVVSLGSRAWSRLAAARAADVLFDLGRASEARAAYRDVLAHPSPEVDAAVARFRLAELAARAGERGTAVDGFLHVYAEHPAHPLADVAWERVHALAPALVPMPAQRLERSRRLLADRGWQRSLDELALLPADLPPALRDEADYLEGMTHFRMRQGYDVAAAKLMGVWPRLASSRQAEALFHGARAYSRADQDDRAIAGYKLLLDKFPHSKPAPEAAFLIGWLEFNRGRYADAVPALKECLRRYGDSKFADDAHWYLGFSRWLLGDDQAALEDLDWLAHRSGSREGGKGRYWRGRALERLGRVDEAVAEWRRLPVDFPLSYYAQCARMRLARIGIHVDPFGREPGSPSGSREASVEGIGAIDAAVTSDHALVRTDELLRAGLGVEAARALDEVDQELVTRYGVARALPVLLDRYERAEDYYHVHRLAEGHASAALKRDPEAPTSGRSSGARSWWEKVYPLAYRRHVECYAPTGKNPPYYLYTIMQMESAYNPHDVSYADAIGLLQMIPPTSRKVAPRIGRPYTDDVLYDPEGNIQFGAWYIGALLEKFKGQIPVGAGSFNAGPVAMLRWLQKNGAHPLDEFIELCSYTQTREYMKSAIHIYSRYEWLYARRDYLPDEKVDTNYVRPDIDY